MNNIVLGREEKYGISPQIWTYDILRTIVNGIHLNFCNTAEGFQRAYLYRKHTSFYVWRMVKQH